VITPNKVVTLETSALGKAHFILSCGPRVIELVELFHKVERHFESIDHFLLTLDLLYVLGRIDVDFRTRTVNYAD
jgi:hypothetical protein